MLKYVFLCSFYDPLKFHRGAIMLLVESTPALHTPPHSADLQLSLLIFLLLINGVRHTIWMGYLKIFFSVLYVSETA